MGLGRLQKIALNGQLSDFRMQFHDLLFRDARVFLLFCKNAGRIIFELPEPLGNHCLMHAEFAAELR